MSEKSTILKKMDNTPVEDVKISITDCNVYHKNNINYVLGLLDKIEVSGVENCKNILTIYEILQNTIIPMENIEK